MEDEYQRRLEKPLIEFYKNVKKNIDMEKIYNDLKKNSNKDSKKYSIYVYQLVKYKIFNNKIYVDKEIRKKYKDKSDNRLEQNLNLIEKTIEYCKKNNLLIPNTTLYIWISDRVPWVSDEINKYDNLPIFVYSKPKDSNFAIFPDNTFECFSIESKYNEKCYEWEIIKNKMIEYNKIVKNKENKIFFKGTNTTNLNHNIRKNLEIYAKSNKNYIIQLDAWNKYIPIYKFADYKILLNLPGRYPWSNRLKYLFLTKSLVININVITIFIDDNNIFIDDEWETLIDYILEKNDYINLTLKYYEYNGKNENVKNKILKMNEREFNKIISKINNIYNDFNINEKKYDKIIKNGYDKVSKLTMDRIYSYIYRAIVENSKIIK